MDQADKSIVLAVLEEEYPATLILDEETLDAAMDGRTVPDARDDSQAKIDLHSYAMLVKDVATIVTALVALATAARDAYALAKPAGGEAKALADRYQAENRLPARVDSKGLLKIAEVVARLIWGK